MVPQRHSICPVVFDVKSFSLCVDGLLVVVIGVMVLPWGAVLYRGVLIGTSWMLLFSVEVKVCGTDADNS